MSILVHIPINSFYMHELCFRSFSRFISEMLFQRRCRMPASFNFIAVSVAVFILFWFWHFWSHQKLTENIAVDYVKLSDDSNINPNTVYNKDPQVYAYNKNLPLIWIGGVPRSGTTLMRAMLDAHPSVRCGEETRVIPRVISMKHQWTKHKIEAERLKNAGITDDILNSAVRSFILEVIVRHGKPAERLCNKDPLILRYSNYVHGLFPNSKFILMLRDGRATVHSIISRNVTITGFDLTSYRDCLTKWSSMIETMYAQCIQLGKSICLPVYYEQLVLHPESEMRKILDFLEIDWNEAVINHEKYFGNEISVSKTEKSTDQIMKPVNLDALTSWVGHIPEDVLIDMDSIAPMLKKLGYDPFAINPVYGLPDSKIMQNTNNIKANKQYWSKKAQIYSVHEPKTI
jgi:protein-tyrosine sulfotransferase